MTITGVTNTNPGNKPTVTFTATDSKGNPVDATKLASLAFILAGPTTDYAFPSGTPATENALTTVKPQLVDLPILSMPLFHRVPPGLSQ